MQYKEKEGFGRRDGLATLAAAVMGCAVGAAGGRIAAFAGDAATGPRSGSTVIDWSLAAFHAIRAEDGYANPLGASRMLAMMHLGMHDAVNAAVPRYAAHALTQRAAGANPAVAAATAAHDVLLALLPNQRGMLDLELAKAVEEAGRGAEVERGRALGAEAARAVLALRLGDGADGREGYEMSGRPGAYRFTPGFDFIAAPHWRALRPFSLRSPDQFRVSAPPPLTSAAYHAAFEEVKALGGKISAERSADETHYAHFWYEFSDIGWNRIARVVARDAGLDLWEGARLFALVNMALADAYVAGWDSKLHYDAWRPVTAIHAAAEDGNPATQPDPAWEPLLPTPPIQDHPSTHSALGAAAAAVMAGLLGPSTSFAFASGSALPTNPVRRFASFSAAARENAESRIMAGLHFRFACEAGLQLGERIGRWTLAQHLQRLA